MKKRNSSYRQIVKSTSIFGGVQVANIILGIIRQKVIAILLGPLGIGLISVYQSIVDVIKSVSTLGLDTAGVKDIAATSDNKEAQSYKISVFRWWIRLTSSFGALICLVFCYPISLFAFKDGSHSLHIALLSICIFFTSLVTGQTVVMQGTRNISLMVKANLWGNATGLIISLIIYYFLGIKGIIPAFITGSIILIFFSTIFARKINIQKIPVSNHTAFKQGLSTLKLGTFIVSVSIMESASMLIIKSFLTHRSGVDAVGMLQPALTITMVYLSLILKSMGTDFFPRLCMVANKAARVRKLVNEQTHIALIVATPIIVFMMLFAGWVLKTLYTSEFVDGTALLQWHVGGSLFKALSWPIAFILLAKGKGNRYLLSEIIYFTVYLGSSYLLYPYFGIISVGIAYLLSYIAYLIVIYINVAKICRFRWSKENIKLSIISILFVISSIIIVLYFPQNKMPLSILIITLSSAFSIYMFNRVVCIRDFLEEIKTKIISKK